MFPRMVVWNVLVYIQYELIYALFFDCIAKLKSFFLLEYQTKIRFANGDSPIRPNQSTESQSNVMKRTKAGKIKKIIILRSSSLSYVRKFKNSVVIRVLRGAGFYHWEFSVHIQIRFPSSTVLLVPHVVTRITQNLKVRVFPFQLYIYNHFQATDYHPYWLLFLDLADALLQSIC